VTAILRTLGGVPVTITANHAEAEALRASEFHRVTRDNGGTYYFNGGEYDAARRGLREVDPVRRYAEDCLAVDLGKLVAQWKASHDCG
jgi:hypothetical protein